MILKLNPGIDGDTILVTDGNNVYPRCAKSPGIQHEALNISTGELENIPIDRI